LLVSVLAIAGLILTDVAVVSSQGRVEDLERGDEGLRRQAAETSRQLEESTTSATKEIEALRRSFDAQADAEFDPSWIVNEIEGSVFTVVSGNAQGSGFGFLSYGGHTWIATNYHVIKASTFIGGPQVLIRHRSATWSGRAWTWDKRADVALVRVNATLPILESAFENGHFPTVGDSVLAYGSPLGLEGTATVGIVSAIRGGYIQTDAQINHGNSGGPLVNDYGEVIGLTTLGFGDGSGVGFAVDIRTLCSKLMKNDC
jgi:S1-C subfamily serine protease